LEAALIGHEEEQAIDLREQSDAALLIRDATVRELSAHETNHQAKSMSA
jgi:hypothetical protein